MLAFDCINQFGFIMRILVKVVFYLKIFVPIILIVMVVFDLAKAMAGAVDEKAKKEAGSRAIKRLLYAVLVFLIPTLVNFIFRVVDDSISKNGSTADNYGSPTNWISCWNYYNK